MKKKKMDELSVTLREKKCANCGKTFCRINYNNYAYKKVVGGSKKFFCCYSCMREFESKRVVRSKLEFVTT